VVRDLLAEETPALRLLDDPARGTVVEGAREEAVRSARHLRHLLALLEPRRQVGDNGMNEASSRSHLVVRLTIESRPPDPSAAADDASAALAAPGGAGSGALAATINFVDLAGSERSSRTGAEGLRLKEGCHINKSLLTLGTVIRKLAEGAGAGHVPYRDSKLTRILAHALGGNGRTSVVCCCSPAAGALEASRSALLFAENARRVLNYAKVNETVDDKVLLRQYQSEIAALRQQLAQSGGAGAGALAALEQDFRAEQEARARAERRLRGLELFILSGGGEPVVVVGGNGAAVAAEATPRGRRRDADGERRGGRRERASWSPEATPRRGGAAATPGTASRLGRTASLGLASARRLFPGGGGSDDGDDGASSSDETDGSADAEPQRRLPAPLAHDIHVLEAAGGARGAEAGAALANEMRCLRIHTVVGLSSSTEEAELVSRLQDELARLSAERAAGAAADEATLEALRAEVSRLRARAQADRAADTAMEKLQRKLRASQADLDRYAAALAETNARLAEELAFSCEPTPPPPPKPVMAEAACGDDEPSPLRPARQRSADAQTEPALCGVDSSAGPREPPSPQSHRLGERGPHGREASPGWRGPRVLGGLLDTWARREGGGTPNGTPGGATSPPVRPPPVREDKENAPTASPAPAAKALSPPAAQQAGPATGAWVPRACLDAEREQREAEVRRMQTAFAEAVADGGAMQGHMEALRDSVQRAEWQKKRLMAQVLKLEFAAEEAGIEAAKQIEALGRERDKRRRERERRRDAERAAVDATNAAAAAEARAREAGAERGGWGDADGAASGLASPSGLGSLTGGTLADSWAGPPVAAWYLPKILRLWAMLHIPLLHRSRFYLGFRGRETFYFEAEHRRLAWLQASLRGAGAAHPLAGAATALARERMDLERRLRTLAEEERARLCARFGVDAGGKRRKRALAGKLWIDVADAGHLGASAELVLRLHGLEPGQDLAVVFAPPSLARGGGLRSTA
jgi:hypothetical protein